MHRHHYDVLCHRSLSYDSLTYWSDRSFHHLGIHSISCPCHITSNVVMSRNSPNRNTNYPLGVVAAATKIVFIQNSLSVSRHEVLETIETRKDLLQGLAKKAVAIHIRKPTYDNILREQEKCFALYSLIWKYATQKWVLRRGETWLRQLPEIFYTRCCHSLLGLRSDFPTTLSGVGVAMGYACFFVCLYFNIILAYAMVYIVHSLKTPLPWTECNPEWADDECFVRGVTYNCKMVEKRLVDIYEHKTLLDNDTIEITYGHRKAQVPFGMYHNATMMCTNATQTSVEQFFYKAVLSISKGIEYPGAVKPDLTISLFLAWVIVCISLSKGIKTSGKIVYVTAPAPYIILAVLLIRGVTLPGSLTGIAFFLIPDWEKMLSFQVWQAACQQMFYSLGVSMGPIICLGSYNNFRNDLRRDITIITFADFITSIFGGLVVFSVLGNMAHNLHVDIEDVAEKGHGLAFVTYPEAASLIKWPNLWAFAFFFMLFLLAVDSQFAMFESVLVPLKDEFPLIRGNSGKFLILLSLASFLMGISMTTQGGLYVLNLIDSYLGGMIFPIIAVFELYTVCWFYGIRNLSLDIEFMLGSPPGYFVKLCWGVICPIALTVIVFVGILTHSRTSQGSYVYPLWADVVGFLLLGVGLVQIPIFAFMYLRKNDYDFKSCLKPSPDWGPYKVKHFRDYKEFLRRKQLEEEDELKPPGTSQESPEPSPEPITPEQPRRIAKA